MPPIEWLEMCLSAFKKGLGVAPEAMEEYQRVLNLAGTIILILLRFYYTCDKLGH